MSLLYRGREEDIIKISKAVKAEIFADINKLIHARTEPLVQKISKLETENKQLQKDLDALEQYGRRSLVVLLRKIFCF
jgi:cell division protein FtsB